MNSDMNKEDREKKWVRLIEMTEHPERYTGQQWREVADDEEMAWLYRMMTESAQAFDAQRPLPDDEEVEEAWRELEQRRSFSITARRRRLRYAAVFTGILLSGVALAALYPRISRSLRHDTGITEQVGVEMAEARAVGDTVNPPVMVAQRKSEVVVFNGERLEQIVDTIAAYYGCKSVFVNEDAKALRLHLKWNQAESAESIVDKLNRFEKVNISISNQTVIVK